MARAGDGELAEDPDAGGLPPTTTNVNHRPDRRGTRCQPACSKAEPVPQVDDIMSTSADRTSPAAIRPCRVSGLATAGHDQLVVIEAVAAVEDHLPALGVGTCGDLSVAIRTVVPSPCRARASIGEAQSLGDSAHRGLVEERLEQVVIVAVDEGHVRVGVAQLAGCGQRP